MNDIIDFFMLKRLLRSFNTFIGHLNIDYPLLKNNGAIVMRYSSVEGTALLLLLGLLLTSYSVKIKTVWLFEVLLGE
jgi:hypothetical protein